MITTLIIIAVVLFLLDRAFAIANRTGVRVEKSTREGVDKYRPFQ